MSEHELDKLSEIMRADWDRRVAHDYRFWMSDGYQTDEAMWKSGARDLDIMLEDCHLTGGEVVLDVGCGVGRLLRSALARSFSKVIGIDVSENAVKKAKELIGSDPRLEVHVGNGVNLDPVLTASIDVVVSYAAIGSIPTPAFAAYLAEFSRVLRPGGQVRVQMYVGPSQQVATDDTLYVRCYESECLKRAAALAGLEIEGTKELVLPIKVSFKELGIEAVVVSLRKIGDAVASASEIEKALGQIGPQETVANSKADLEYWMTVNYAKELAEKGDVERAQATLDYATTISKTTSIDVSDILDRVVRILGEREKTALSKNAASQKDVSQNGISNNSTQELVTTKSLVFESNRKTIQGRFPKLAAELATQGSRPETCEIRETEQGPVLSESGQCLDHPQKPLSAGQSWAKKLLKEEKNKNADQLVVVGCGCGYHIAALCDELDASGSSVKVVVIEPSTAAFLAAMSAISMSGWLSRVQDLRVGLESDFENSTSGFELVVRPQAIALYPDFCAKLRSHFYGARGLSLLHPTIGVVGPLHGGTLPIMSYVTLGLHGLEQRTRQFDVSGFNQGYLNLENFVKDKARRNGVERTYTEMVSQIVLESIDEKPIDILLCMAFAPLSQRVLSELRRRGIITVLWFVEDYVRFTYWKELAQFYDFVFTIQKGKCIDAIKQAGAGEVHYLPVACDPSVHTPLNLSEQEKRHWGSPVSFMGAGYHNRQQMFATLAELPLKIWGSEWPTCKPFDRLVQEDGRRLLPADYVKVFAASDININLHSSTERDGVDPFGDFLNPRTFELASCGAFQLVDERSLLSEAFKPGSEMVTFKDARELKEKVAYYLAHPKERATITDNARKRVLSEHTYQHRLRQMLSIIYSSKYEHLKARQENSGWAKVFRRVKSHPELNAMCEKAYKRGEEPSLDGIVSDVVTGQGKLSDTEKKLLFLHHVKKQIIRMTREEKGERQ